VFLQLELLQVAAQQGDALALFSRLGDVDADGGEKGKKEEIHQSIVDAAKGKKDPVATRGAGIWFVLHGPQQPP
jgi:hypothetical protein